MAYIYKIYEYIHYCVSLLKDSIFYLLIFEISGTNLYFSLQNSISVAFVELSTYNFRVENKSITFKNFIFIAAFLRYDNIPHVFKCNSVIFRMFRSMQPPPVLILANFYHPPKVMWYSLSITSLFFCSS